MFRRVIALLFCLAAWAALAHVVERSADDTMAVTAGRAPASDAGAAAPRDADDSDGRWAAAHRAIVTVTESHWKTSVAHAYAAATPSGHAFADTSIAGHRHRPPRARAAHLLHVPLLI